MGRGYIASLSTDLEEEIKAVGDFDGDNKSDLLLRNKTNGAWTVVFMDGTSPKGTSSLPLNTSELWTFNAANDFNGDGFSDVTLKNSTTGELTMYLWNEQEFYSEVMLESQFPNEFQAKSLTAISLNP